MDWTFKDTLVLAAMAFAVISMSFVFPALGLEGTNQNTSDVPDFNVTTERFNSTQDYPPYPIRPDEGTLNHTSNKFDDFEGSIQYELGTNDGGNRTFLVVNPENKTYITDVENNSIDDEYTWTVAEEGDVQTLDAGGYEIDVFAVDVSAGVYEYHIEQRPGSSQIPILGGLLNTGGEIVQVLWWMFLMLGYGTRSLFASAGNLAGIGFDIGAYIISMFHWLTTTYLSFSDGIGNNFVSVILYLPAIILFLMFGKLMAVMFSVVRG